MKIAIIGTGISGLMCGHLLHPQHDITLFEANNYIGGHTHTVNVEVQGRSYDIDTGFIVHNDRTYPNFIRLLRDLDVEALSTSMSFSVRCDRSRTEYNGTSLNGVFAQRGNLFRPSFHRMLRDILRFNREAPSFLDGGNDDMTVGQYLREHQYSTQFANLYLLPMGAAIWSCPTQTFEQFPVRFIIEFYHNHGLLQIRDRPLWRVIKSGSNSYVQKLVQPFRDRIRLNCPVQAVARHADRVTLQLADGSEDFDEVIFACHSDQAIKLLTTPSEVEQGILSAFPYGLNSVLLHTDASVLPKRRRAWAAWNYHIAADSGERPMSPELSRTMAFQGRRFAECDGLGSPSYDSYGTTLGPLGQRPTVTYNMNILQHIDSPHTFCVTLNEDDSIDPAKVLGRYKYAHPVYTTKRAAAQRRHAEVIRQTRTSFCGAYWGNGFHEDGVNSAIAVCRAFGIDWGTG